MTDDQNALLGTRSVNAGNSPKQELDLRTTGVAASTPAGDLPGNPAKMATIVTERRRQSSRSARALTSVLNLDDFQTIARRRLPRPIYEYYAGAAETGQSFAANRSAFLDAALVPRVLVDVSARSPATTLFGRAYRLPIGIAPMGLSGLSTFEGDLVLARAAADENIPMIVSATSIMPLERLAAEGSARWFQSYLPGEPERIKAMVDRVAAAGYETLVLTVDLPVPANRENNIRTGFSIPLRPSIRLALDGLLHPRWSIGTFARTMTTGVPRFENMDAFRGPPILSRNLVRSIGARDQLNWNHVQSIRDRWKGTFVLKGILAAQDAARARECGVDGIIVSNHGGRQLDGAISPLHVLPQIVQQANGMRVMLDGGVRRGTDVLKALAAGADFIFIGRPFLFAAVLGGGGVRHAIQLIGQEIDRDMAMLGANTVGEIDSSFLTKP